MNLRKSKLFLGLAVAGFLQTPLFAQSPMPLREAKFIEVVNEVQVADSAESSAIPVTVEDIFSTPQVLISGRRSRAQLQAEDGTITRVGSNTVFSFSEDSRDVYLKRGSLLFNSPEGRGGGKVVTASAVATVLGTTLIVSATRDGGFKVLVMEGHADVSYTDGTTVRLEAGQMTFVLPGQMPIGATNLPETMREPGDPPPGVPTPDMPGSSDGQAGPVMNFDLERQQQSSALVNGFQSPLPSMPQINNAIERQSRAIRQGTLEGTGQRIVGATEDSVIVSSTDTTINQEAAPNQSPRARSVRTDATLTSATPPDNLSFESPVSFSTAEAPFLAVRNPYRGLIARELNLQLPTLNLSRFHSSDQNWVDIAAERALNIPQSVTIAESEPFSLLRISAGTLSANAGGLREQIPASGPAANGQLELWIGQNANLRDSAFYFPRTAFIDVLEGNWEMTSSNFTATGDLNFQVNGSFNANESLIGGEHIFISADSVNLNQTRLNFTGSNIERIGTTIEASETLNISDVHFPHNPALRGLEQVSLNARTIALQNVNFTPGSVVILRSEVGMLAPDPNTSRPALPGYVNFIRDVTYGGAPAQDYVAPERGGTGIAPTRIEIGPRP